MTPDLVRRFLRAGFATAIADGLFSSVLSAFFYGSTVTRLFQGVASTVLGKEALEGGLFTALVGIGLHVFVAFGWSAVFVFLVLRAPRVRAILESPYGPAKVAAVFGPLVWVAMSAIVIPILVHRPPNITPRWWVQFFGHAVFVGLPIALAARGSQRLPPASESGT
jgi:hypothetical protein